MNRRRTIYSTRGAIQLMPMLVFMPWCGIDKSYEVGEIEILPFEKRRKVQGLNDVEQRHLKQILSMYKNIQGRAVDKAALVRSMGKPLIAELSDEELDVVFDEVALACFSGLANRAYLNSIGPYCNSDCFSLIVQKFDDASFTALTTRRREGRFLSGWPVDEIAVTVPANVHTISEVRLDERLLKSLVSHRSAVKGEWGRWQNAISCFNQANTDSDNIRYQVEWVLLCSAFEHLLNAKSNGKDVARKFSENMVPSESLPVSNAKRRLPGWADKGKSLRYEWVREFYRIRGDFAHGRLNTKQPSAWNPLEHLVLASIAFPLLVKSLLSKAGTYILKDEDLIQVEVFEELADTVDFLKPPADQKNSIDSHLRRLITDRKWKMASKRAFNQISQSRSAEEPRVTKANETKEKK